MADKAGWLRGLFGGRKRTFRDLEMDDLRRENIRLEQMEAQMVKKLDQLEDQKKLLFQQGARPEVSAQQRVVLANKMKQADVKSKNQARNVQFVQKQLRVIGGLIQLKENESLWAGSPLLETLSGMDLANLEKIIEDATVEGSFQLDRLERILLGMEEAEGVARVATADSDVMDIAKEMEQAAAMAAEDPSAVDLAWQKVSTDILGAEEEPGTAIEI